MDASVDIARHAALDARLVKAVRGIKLLSLASWPAAVQVEFLERWRRGPLAPAAAADGASAGNPTAD